MFGLAWSLSLSVFKLFVSVFFLKICVLDPSCATSPILTSKGESAQYYVVFNYSFIITLQAASQLHAGCNAMRATLRTKRTRVMLAKWVFTLGPLPAINCQSKNRFYTQPFVWCNGRLLSVVPNSREGGGAKERGKKKHSEKPSFKNWKRINKNLDSISDCLPLPLWSPAVTSDSSSSHLSSFVLQSFL